MDSVRGIEEDEDAGCREVPLERLDGGTFTF
jgi:hypothetical protein